MSARGSTPLPITKPITKGYYPMKTTVVSFGKHKKTAQVIVKGEHTSQTKHLHKKLVTMANGSYGYQWQDKDGKVYEIKEA